MPRVSAGVSATIQPKTNGPWTTSTSDSSVPTCAVDMAGVTMVFAGIKHLPVLKYDVLICQVSCCFVCFFFFFLGGGGGCFIFRLNIKK